MKISTVDPACTGLFSPLFLDYIHQEEKLKPFYSRFPTLANFKEALEKRNFSSSNREVLAAELEKQYESIAVKPKVDEQIELLKRNNTFTVTTGHQLNLMTGPLYFIYKIVSTIKLAQQLKEAYPEAYFVPVYWMASEDHDFEEINHFVFDGKKYEWKSGQTGAVGAFEIDDFLRNLLQELRFLPEFFKEAYRESPNLADAVRKYVHHLFGEYGLVVIDPNSAALKRLFSPIIKDDLEAQHANALVQEQNEQLEALGYKTQVFPREINFFYLAEGIRERIVKSGDGFQVMNSDLKWTKEALFELLDNHPERFSPNVVMRPLYQEVILPNLAYLGGPAEVAYWFQLKKVFDNYSVDYPVIMPRNFGLVIPRVAARKIAALGLTDEDLFKDYDELRINYVINHSAEDVLLSEEKNRLAQLYDGLSEALLHTNPTLQASAKAAKERSMKIMQQLSKKLRIAQEQKQETSIRRIKEVKESLFPGKVPQERKLNFLNFYLDRPSLVQELLDGFDPLDFRVFIFHADEGE